jgi:hypothetical protein
MGVANLLNAVSANTTGPVVALGTPYGNLTLEVVTTGTVSAFSVQLYGSLDSQNWEAIGSAVTSTTAGESAGSGVLFQYFYATLSGYSGTGTVTAILAYSLEAAASGGGGPPSGTAVDWLNVVNGYGATGSGKMVTDAAVTASGTTLTSASAGFTSASVGMIGVIMGAGALNGSIGTPLAFTITGYTNATTVTISATATTTVSGAVCYFGTDDAAAIQSAITACASGQTVFLPNAVFMLSTSLSVTKPMRLTGDGATIVTTNSAAIDFGNTYISAGSSTSTTAGLEIDHLVLDCSGGHIFQNINWNKARLHDLRLVQRSYNYAAFYSTNSSANQLDLYCDNIVTRVCGAPRTVQSWYVLSSIGGGMAMCKWQNCLWQNADGDTTQYAFEADCTGTHNYTNDLVFDMCWFDHAFGGAVKLLSCQGAAFRSCNIIDSYTQTIDGASVSWGTHSAYYIGAYSGGSNWASQKISFTDCSRDLQGPNGSTSWDIYTEAATDCVTISNYEVRDIPGTSVFYPYFNFNGCTDVVVINCPDAVITNSATSQIELGPSGNIGFTGTLSGATLPPIPLPSDAGYISWTFDPSKVTGVGTSNASTNLYLAAVFARTAQTISDVVFWIGTGGGTLVAGECFAGLFSGGTLLSASGDCSGTTYTVSTTASSATVTGTGFIAAMVGAQYTIAGVTGTFTVAAVGSSTSLTMVTTVPTAVTSATMTPAGGNNWSSSGLKTVPLATPQAVSAGWYWAALLANGGTAPKIAVGSTQSIGSTLVANAGSSGGSRRYALYSSYGTSLANFSTGSLADPTFALWAAVK